MNTFSRYAAATMIGFALIPHAAFAQEQPVRAAISLAPFDITTRFASPSIRVGSESSRQQLLIAGVLPKAVGVIGIAVRTGEPLPEATCLADTRCP